MSTRHTEKPADERSRHRLDFVHAHTGTRRAALERASEDAGMRSYWRLPGHGVLMDAPPADNNLAAWLAMQALLRAGGVRVPRVLAGDLEHGFLLLEDLGSQTLLDIVDGDNADAFFEQAGTQLLRLQAIRPPAGLRHYDAALLTRDLDLFQDWFVGRELGYSLTADEQQAWQNACRVLMDAAQSQRQVLVHRDFMPRNLMPLEGELAVIDFQDAVIGPIAYDPASLFKDAFISWPEARVEGWLRHYHEQALAAGLPVPAWPRFRRDVDLAGIHRHLKILGVFARLKCRDGKPDYLADAPRFIGYLDAVLPRYPELASLHRLLSELPGRAWQQQAGT